MENFQMESKSIAKTKKTIKVLDDQNGEYTVNFINEGTKLTVEAKTFSEFLTVIYSNQFSLQDIKKLVRLFNDDYNSIEDCLTEINFDTTDKDERKTEIEKPNNENIILKVPLYSKRYPFINFSLKKLEKNEEQKFSELLGVISNMKKKQENEIKFLNDKINFLENLLIVKKNEDYKKGLELFQGSVIEMTCFGSNDIRKYFDLEQEYVHWKENEKFNYKFPGFISFVFKCKNDKDIPLVIESFQTFKKVYSQPDIVFTRVDNNKIFIELRCDEHDFFEGPDSIITLCLAMGQSLIIKTHAIPRNFFEEYDRKKLLKFILDTELDFKNLSPQLILFALFIENRNFNSKYFLNDIFRDIFLNLVNGNYKYKVGKSLIEDDIEKINQILQDIFFDIMEIVKLKGFKEYKKVNFDEIEINWISTKYKTGFNCKLKLPLFNELIEEYLTEKLKVLK